MHVYGYLFCLDWLTHRCVNLLTQVPFTSLIAATSARKSKIKQTVGNWKSSVPVAHVNKVTQVLVSLQPQCTGCRFGDQSLDLVYNLHCFHLVCKAAGLQVDTRPSGYCVTSSLAASELLEEDSSWSTFGVFGNHAKPCAWGLPQCYHLKWIQQSVAPKTPIQKASMNF